MKYQDWPVESTAFIGNPGGLVPIPISENSSIKDSTDANWTYQTTVSGAVHAQRTLYQRRKWDVDLEEFPASYFNALRAISLGSYGWGPFAWITPHAQATNLVTVDDSLLVDTTIPVGYVLGGPLVLDGQWVPQTRVCAPGSIKTFAATSPIPINPLGGEVAASAWIKGDGARIVFRWIYQGGSIYTETTGTWPLAAGSSNWTRVSISGPPKLPTYNPVAVQIMADGVTGIGGVQVRWGKDALGDYHPGEGCTGAVISETPRTFGQIDSDGSWAKTSFTVTEVG